MMYSLLFIFITILSQHHCSPSYVDLKEKENEQFNLKPYQEYFNLSAKYWGPNSGRATECLQHAQSDGWKYTDESMMNVGLEGSGHHLILSMGPSIPPHDHGGKRSFSTCGTCPSKSGWRHDPKATASNPTLNNKSHGKFLVLIRDPVDTFHSALRRFWKQDLWSIDTLEKEKKELLNSMKAMERELLKISCSKTLFISYELLIHFPDAHVNVMANFLGVGPRHPGLMEWFEKIKQSVAEYTNDFGDPYTLVKEDSVGPFPIHCGSPDMEKKFAKFAWPDGWEKDCDEGKCEEGFYEKTRAWVHPALKKLFPAIVPQHAMSYCAATGNDTASETR